MEDNTCDINHLDSDVLLPPRKRLLACLKKQNGDGNSYSPSTSSPISNEFDSRLNNLLRSHLDNHDLSQEEIVEATRSAAEVAVKVAVAARAAAEEKAAIAAKAVAAAKSALELVANVADDAASTGRYSKKNKMIKKSVQVQMLYNHKKQRVENSNKTDEELARKLHQAINSSPRISKYCSPSDLKSHKHKRLKGLNFSENNRGDNGSYAVGEVNSPSTSNGNDIARERETYIVKVDENTSKFNKADMSKMENGEAERIHSKEKSGEEDASSTLGRKRGRMKQKKLPLSSCNFRDQANPKEDQKSSRSSDLSERNIGKATAANKPLLSVGPSGNSVMPVERTSLWKCQAFKAPACVKQNKVIQS